MIAICYEMPLMGSSEDLQDTVVQANFVEKYLVRFGYEVRHIPYHGDLVGFLQEVNGAELAWNLFESFNGEERQQHLGAALLEMANLRYTGSPLAALAMIADKRTVKKILQLAGVTTPPEYHKGVPAQGQWIIKPALLHGSVGISDDSVVNIVDENELITILRAQPYVVFAEKYIAGDEYSVSLLDRGDGLKALATAKMSFINYLDDKLRILNYDSKWNESSLDYTQTRRTFDVNPAIASHLGSIAERVADVLCLSGFARIDFRVDTDGIAWVIDVNANPGLGEDTGFVATCAYMKIDVNSMLNHIIRGAYASTT